MKRLSITSTLVCCLSFVAGIFFTGCSEKKDTAKTVRIGHFPNVTHVQPLVARNMARHGKGWFEERIPGYKFEWFTYNAGPSAMEAIFARSLDVTYVGPSPAINAFVRSKGQEVRILAGAADGASALVVQSDGNITKGTDFIGKTIATPQLGNTQDVACRAWLVKEGFNVNMMGGIAKTGSQVTGKGGNEVDVRILPTQNPDQLPLFQQKKLDGVWTVEPWITRLERDANAKVLVEESDAVTTVLAGRVKWLQDNPEIFSKLVSAHEELTDWIKAHPEEAQKMVVEELSELTRTKVSPELIGGAWKRLILTNDISLPGLEKFVKDAYNSGFIEESFDVKNMVERPKPAK